MAKAESEIEITPEMERAGACVLEEHGPFQTEEALVRMVYTAMWAARPERG